MNYQYQPNPYNYVAQTGNYQYNPEHIDYHDVQVEQFSHLVYTTTWYHVPKALAIRKISKHSLKPIHRTPRKKPIATISYMSIFQDNLITFYVFIWLASKKSPPTEENSINTTETDIDEFQLEANWLSYCFFSKRFSPYLSFLLFRSLHQAWLLHQCCYQFLFYFLYWIQVIPGFILLMWLVMYCIYKDYIIF